MTYRSRNDMASALFVKWLETSSNLGAGSEEERREMFSLAANISFEAAEEFFRVRRRRTALIGFLMMLFRRRTIDESTH